MIRLPATLILLLTLVTPAAAQNWTFDARRIGLGAVGGGENLASRMIGEREDYRTIVLPFGLLQVLKDIDVLRPDSDEFNFVRTIEYAASPIHFIIGREDETSVSGRDFFVDVANAEVSRDLSDYRVLRLANQPVAEGLASPSWGATIPVSATADGSFQGIFVGAGPYMAMRTLSLIDPQLIDIFGSEDPLRLPNERLDLSNTTEGQIALAITGGYRGRFAAGTGSDRDGVYVAANFNYLRGFRYEDIDTALRLDTDSAGLLTINPLLPAPLIVSRTTATSGRGFAVDAGVSAVINGWEAGFGINGIGNRIDWTDADVRTYSLDNLLFGNDEFNETDPVPVGDIRVELPVDYRLNGGYRGDVWSVLAEYGHGFQGDSFHGGAEYRFGGVDVRGGGLYTREMWQPTVGVGLNFTDRVALDVALFGTAANAARERKTGIAVSLRLAR